MPNPNKCPRFAYCPAGSAKPTACPDGTWTPWEGSTAASDCITCPRGTYCRYASLYAEQAANLVTAAHFADPSTALGPLHLAGYAGPCQSGYVCLEGASSAAPTDGLTGFPCPAGTQCTVDLNTGVTIAVPCELGHYAATAGLELCQPCPGGTYCPERGYKSPATCPQGHYCPAGSLAPRPCRPGTFSTATGLSSASQCTPCTPGQYCESAGAATTTGPCKAGFVCGSGSSTPAPWGAVWSSTGPVNGRCPVGHFCPQGSGAPQPCPVG